MISMQLSQNNLSIWPFDRWIKTNPWDEIKNFKSSEFDQPGLRGSGGRWMSILFVKKLDRFRDMIGKQLTITSGYRSRPYNASLPDAAINSLHIPQLPDFKTKAADLHSPEINLWNLFKLANNYLEFQGVVYEPDKGIIHIDDRTTKGRGIQPHTGSKYYTMTPDVYNELQKTNGLVTSEIESMLLGKPTISRGISYWPYILIGGGIILTTGVIVTQIRKRRR